MNNDFIKLTSKIYSILDFLPDGDPIKNKAKEKTLKLLEGLTLLYTEKTGGWYSLKELLPENAKSAKILLVDLNILENYLRIAKNQGWIGDVNFLIILKEMDQIGGELKDLGKKQELLRENSDDYQNYQINGLQPRFKEANTTKRSAPLAFQPFFEPIIKKQQVKKSEVSVKTSPRQKKILQILNNKGKAQVADIIKEIPQVTKRTIRRDLDALLKGNKITREGRFNQVFYKVA